MSGGIPEIVVFGTRGGGFSLGDSFRFAINNSSGGQNDGNGGTTNSVSDVDDGLITFPNGLIVSIDISELPANVKEAFLYLTSHLDEFPAFADIITDLANRGYNEINLFTNSIGPLDANGNLLQTWAATVPPGSPPGSVVLGATDYSVNGSVAITFNGGITFNHTNAIGVIIHEFIHAAYPSLSEPDTKDREEQIVDDIFDADPDVEFDGFDNSVSGQGSSSNNNLSGSTGHDYLSGEGGNDNLYGQDGDDYLEGGSGNDNLFGAAGNDLLVAGTGVDNLYGGSGDDQYILDSNLAANIGDTSGNDLLEIEFTSSVSFDDVGNDLHISGGGQQAIIYNWFNGQEIEVLRLGNNSVFSAQEINQIIDLQNNGGGGGFEAPIVFDLDGDGIELVDLDEREVKIDWNGDGKREYSGWVSADDGLLFYDQNDNEKFDGAHEITFTQFAEGAKTDLEGLAGLDDNGDGEITKDDAVWDDLFVWRDLNQNGKSNKNELFTLDELGIEAISLSSDNELSKNEGNVIFGQSTYRYDDGSVGIIADVALRTDSANYEWQDPGDLFHAVSDFYA